MTVDGERAAARATSSPSTAPPARCIVGARQDARAGARRRLRDADGLGRRRAPPEGPHQRRHAARRAPGARVRRRGHRPLPHRAHVLRRRAHPRRARDDPRRRRRRPPRRALDKLLPMQREDFVGIFNAHGRACRSRSACSIRRCTSSCRTTDEEIAERRQGDWASTPSSCATRVDGAARVQPDARPPRLPARRHLSRDLRDAGARDLRGGAATSAQKTGEPVDAGDHDPARRHADASSTLLRARHRRDRRRRCMPGDAAQRRLPRRHDDRAAARRAARRRDRRAAPSSSASAPTT